jgi:hypothetical protein
MHAIIYARLNINKGDLDLHGIYFGGLAKTPTEADQLARNCVNSTKTHMIIPKVMDITDGDNLIDVMYDAAEKFDKMFNHMKEASETIALNKSKKL